MNELYIPKPNVLRLKHQPEFPSSDLTEANADLLKYVLNLDSGITAQGEHLKPFQRYIHLIADYALKLSGVKTRYSEDELVAFSHGFASFETIDMMVHPPRLYDTNTAQKKVKQLLITPELELAERQSDWQQKLPNTFDVVINLGEKRQETMEQLHARTAGAHIAYQLATEDLDVA